MPWPRTVMLTAGLLASSLALPALGQSLTTLHGFSALNSVFVNDDGAFPTANLILVNNTLYGTASQGGTAAGGSVFKINTDGTAFLPIYNFTPPNPGSDTAGDGAYPLGPLALAGNLLVGTTSSGGASDSGIVFKMNLDGSGFVAVHEFTTADPNTYANADGAFPWAGLVVSGNTLYGTATRGGDGGAGTVFKVNLDGSGFSRLHSFTAPDATTGTNADGAYPLGGLLLLNNVLYGTTYRGGALNMGTIFKVNPDGSGFTTLQHSDGGPRAGLVALGNTLYGTTESGGTQGGGTVFELNTDGSSFTNLQNFAGAPGSGPWASLLVASNLLYGTSYGGGDSGQGSLFALKPDGSGFTNLYSFTGGNDGAHPQADITLAGSTIFGTASEGGTSGNGTLFKLGATQSGPVQLSIIRIGSDAILSWPASASGLVLQASTTLASPIGWAAVSPGPVVVNGFNTVTNPISTATKFFRLSQ